MEPRRYWLAAPLLALSISTAAMGEEAAVPECRPPASLAPAATALPHAREALRAGRELDILALGSGSLLGPHGGVAGSVPERMVEHLRSAVPGAAVRLTMHAGRADTAADMLASLRRELAGRRWHLVLWQTGTVEALNHQPAPAQFRELLDQGAAMVAAAGADLVLIDLPYIRLLQRRADLDPYQAAIQAAAAQPGAALFPRYELMRDWAESGAFDLEASAKPDRRRNADRLRACLGEALAEMLLPAAPP